MWFRRLLLATLVACASLAPAARAQSCQGEPDGTACPDDLDPCTRDRCNDEACEHPPVPLLEACTPITTPYQRVLVLRPFASALHADVLGLEAPTLPEQRRASLAAEIRIANARLTSLDAVLTGLAPGAGDYAQTRAAAGLSYAREAVAAVKRFLHLLRNTQQVAEIDADASKILRRSARDLLRGCNEVKRDLTRLNQISQVFRP